MDVGAAKAKSSFPMGSFSLGLAFGLMTMYLSDPVSGRRRRARLRAGGRRMAGNALAVSRRKLRDFGHRARGLIAKTLPKADVEVDDVTLLQRIRSELGHAIHRPRSLELDVHHGQVVLRGSVAAGQARALLTCLQQIPGVREVRNEMSS
jgi:osmotically-inducible protein OsmY